MTSFTYTWNTSFLTTPADTEDRSLGAQRIRDTKFAVGERLGVDHSLAGDSNDGKHSKMTLLPQASTGALTLDAGNSAVWSATVSGVNELFYQDSNGAVTQLTSKGALTATGVLVGEIRIWTTVAAPSLWLLAYGQAVSRTTYAALFAVIGTTYGGGDGVTTFNLPDLRGRTVAGADNMGGSTANRLTSTSLGVAATLAVAGGDERTQSHNHTLNDPGHQHTIHQTSLQNIGTGANTLSVNGGNTSINANCLTTASTTGITAASYGAGNSQNVQPTLVLSYIIYAGV